ncbi:unnamed protein product [Chironomus riparius]|uniref:Uncharacterized protein n=1 Tax=Chironomus riparius TaxID=315576 RepID=A0A9N9RQL6_9DIPT|nr:unnamed protein product [Chironomus riparius]
MKNIIFVFALIAAASCDVSHIVQGDGWFKDETGYHYTQPETKFDAPAAEEPASYVSEVVAEPEIVNEPEQVIVEEIVEYVAPEAAPVVADAVAEVNQDYLPPLNNDYLPPVPNTLRDYLPPNDSKRKRQVVRKVYRRFLKRH